MPSRTPQTSDENHLRRATGSYYTPAYVARYMARRCLVPVLRDISPSRLCGSLRILDPACGDGVFLLEIFDLLQRWYLRHQAGDHNGAESEHGNVAKSLSPADRVVIVRDHLFGVDIDSTAIEALRKELLKRIAPGDTLFPEADRVVRSKIQCGDALTGPDFQSGSQRLLLSDSDSPADSSKPGSLPRPLDWSTAFPELADAGGFDLVIGNPPYRRELLAREMFARVAESPLGRRWRQARMDFWYYFLHRGLDLLRPGGQLSLIVNSYWTASVGARKMIARLEQSTTLEDILLLGNLTIFPGVAGRHLIFRLRTGAGSTKCRVLDASCLSCDAAELFSVLSEEDSFENPTARPPQIFASGQLPVYKIPQRNLYHQGRLILSRPDPAVDWLNRLPTLGTMYEVRQGLVENPARVTPRLNRQFENGYCPGEGVFVLTEQEVAALQLSDHERNYLRPFYEPAALGRYRCSDQPSHWLIYFTRRTMPTPDGCPKLMQHLSRFRPILERRRETRLGRVAWWQLHWPREERIFTQRSILNVQMGREPQFVMVEQPTFVGFSINLILEKTDSLFSLPVLTGILNSALAQRWLTRFAKRRGTNLEINGGLLREFPLPSQNSRLERQIHNLVLRRQSLSRLVSRNASAEAVSTRKREQMEMRPIESEINELVDRLYEIAPGPKQETTS